MKLATSNGPPPALVLSVIIPAFNQEDEILATLRATIDVLEREGIAFEILVVSDGSTDNTGGQASRIGDPRVCVLEYAENHGKGHALTLGSSHARGAWVAWMDADLDLHPSHLPAFLERCQEDDLDALVGSKRHPASSITYPRKRRVYSFLYQTLIRTLFRFNVRDTQVGLKVFRRELVDAVIPLVLVKRFAFDVEVLAIARHLGFRRIEEHPITLTYQFSGSGIRPRTIAHSLWDTLAIFYRMRIVRSYERRGETNGHAEWR